MAGNPLAEKRRLRKLENQRLEEDARWRQEELRAAQEQERQRIENERVAEQQRKLYERELNRLKKQAELDRIARLEREERDVATGIEAQLRLVGAFCTGELELPGAEDGDAAALPVSVVVLTLSALETPITNVTESSVVLVADSGGMLHAYSLISRGHMFSASFAGSEFALRFPSAMCITRSAHLIVCDQERSGCAFIDLRALFKVYCASASALDTGASACSNSDSSNRMPVLDGSAALMWFCGNDSEESDGDQFASPQGIAFDDAANELFVSDQMNHRVKVYQFSPVTLADLLKSIKRVSTSSSLTQKKQLALVKKTKKYSPPVVLCRAFGSKGRGNGQLQCPSGLDVSHYHVVVCDVGNHRLAVFAKRGQFVRSVGSKGTGACEFHDIRDVKLVNVRKRAISRGLQVIENTISNEQFEIVVADLGNFRIQVLNESGDFLRHLSLLGSNQQIAFQRDQLNGLQTALLREFAVLESKSADALPSLSGSSMRQLYALATNLHPSCPAYARIAAAQSQWREIRSRFHHPLAITYASTERELVFVDHENAKVFIYNADGSRSRWLRLPSDLAVKGVASVHSALQLSAAAPVEETRKSSVQQDTGAFATNSNSHERLFVSDPLSHRIAVFDAESLRFLFYIGASTYGDQTLCSSGFLPGELHHPTFLASSTTKAGNASTVTGANSRTLLIVSDSGNHSISLFDAWSGAFHRRVGLGFGHLEGYLDSPQSVAVHENRWLYVCDQRNHRIQVFDLQEQQEGDGDDAVATTRFARAFGRLGHAPGEFSFPAAVAICPALLQVDPACNFGPHREAKIVVSDTGNHRVQIFAMDTLQVLLLLDMHLTPLDQPLEPVGVYVEPRSGSVLVCDAANKCVLVFRRDGGFLASFGSTVEPENRFARPTSLSFFSTATTRKSGANGHLLIADAGRNDVCVFELRQALES